MQLKCGVPVLVLEQALDNYPQPVLHAQALPERLLRQSYSAVGTLGRASGARQLESKRDGLARTGLPFAARRAPVDEASVPHEDTTCIARQRPHVRPRHGELGLHVHRIGGARKEWILIRRHD